MPSAQEVRSWYNRRYASLGLDSMRPFEAYPPVLDLLDARPGATLLDVSCGSGFLLRAARERGLTAYGVDLSDAAVRLVHQVSPAIPVAVCAGEDLCVRDASCDFVTCLGSLEHFLDVGRGLREMLRVAKPGAQFCIMVPNRNFAGWKLMGQQGTAQQDINERLLSLGGVDPHLRRARPARAARGPRSLACGQVALQPPPSLPIVRRQGLAARDGVETPPARLGVPVHFSAGAPLRERGVPERRRIARFPLRENRRPAEALLHHAVPGCAEPFRQRGIPRQPLERRRQGGGVGRRHEEPRRPPRSRCP